MRAYIVSGIYQYINLFTGSCCVSAWWALRIWSPRTWWCSMVGWNSLMWMVAYPLTVRWALRSNSFVLELEEVVVSNHHVFFSTKHGNRSSWWQGSFHVAMIWHSSNSTWKVSINDSSISFSPCYCAPEWARQVSLQSVLEVLGIFGNCFQVFVCSSSLTELTWRWGIWLWCWPGSLLMKLRTRSSPSLTWMFPWLQRKVAESYWRQSLKQVRKYHEITISYHLPHVSPVFRFSSIFLYAFCSSYIYNPVDPGLEHWHHPLRAGYAFCPRSFSSCVRDANGVRNSGWMPFWSPCMATSCAMDIHTEKQARLRLPGPPGCGLKMLQCCNIFFWGVGHILYWTTHFKSE